VVKQVAGLYQVNSPNLKPLHAHVIMLRHRFERFAIAHVRRASNSLADSLCNAALEVDDYLRAVRGPEATPAVLKASLARLSTRLGLSGRQYTDLKRNDDDLAAAVLAPFLGLRAPEMSDLIEATAAAAAAAAAGGSGADGGADGDGTGEDTGYTGDAASDDAT